MNALTFRKTVSADLPQLNQLGIAAYSEFKDVLTPDNWEDLYSRLRNPENMSDLLEIATGFVCTDGDTIVGMAFLVPSGNPMRFYQADWSYIRMVGIAPAYQQKGIARRLTEMCIAHAIATGENIITLHTSEMMDAARHIYESMGFTVLRELDPIFGKRYWLYKLDLPDQIS